MELSIGSPLGVLAAAVVNMVVGALWYSPLLYSKPWVKLVGKRMEDLQGGAQTGYVVSFIASIIMACVLSALVTALDITAFWEGAYLGFLLWLGFIATTTASSYIFEGRPRQLYAINVGYYLVSIVLGSGLLAALR